MRMKNSGHYGASTRFNIHENALMTTKESGALTANACVSVLNSGDDELKRTRPYFHASYIVGLSVEKDL